MPLLIAQQLSGIPAGNCITTTASNLDNGHSAISGRSLFARYHQGVNISQSKAADDKTIIGYTDAGLPFIIIADGFFGGETALIFQFVDHYVVPLLHEYTIQLSQGQEAESLTKTLIEKIYQYRKTVAKTAEFTLVLATVYEKEESLYCAGFGIGDIGLVLYSPDTRRLEQLAYPVKADGFKDAFDDITEKKNLSQIIARNSIFNHEVQREDELLGYTYVFNMEQANPGNDEHSTRYCLHLPDLTLPQGRLFEPLLALNQQHFATWCQEQESNLATAQRGDDCMISSVQIPSLPQQQRLRDKVRNFGISDLALPTAAPVVSSKIAASSQLHYTAGATLFGKENHANESVTSSFPSEKSTQCRLQ